MHSYRQYVFLGLGSVLLTTEQLIILTLAGAKLYSYFFLNADKLLTNCPATWCEYSEDSLLVQPDFNNAIKMKDLLSKVRGQTQKEVTELL